MRWEAGQEIPLWTGRAPLSHADGKTADPPTLSAYYPPVWKALGKAVVIFPGGAYAGLAEHEGRSYAEYFTSRGYHCFVVKYHLGSQGYHHPAELADAARAVRMVRAAAKELGIRADGVGVMGSSAGGHLTATLGNGFDRVPLAEDEGECAGISSRPDWMVLCYPVITAEEPFINRCSFEYLLGKNPKAEDMASLSLEKSVSPQTPPTFLWTTTEDTGVPCENSLLFAQALRKAGVKFELHVYQCGEHGMGLFAGHPWAEECVRWMNTF